MNLPNWTGGCTRHGVSVTIEVKHLIRALGGPHEYLGASKDFFSGGLFRGAEQPSRRVWCNRQSNWANSQIFGVCQKVGVILHVKWENLILFKIFSDFLRYTFHFLKLPQYPTKILALSIKKNREAQSQAVLCKPF